MLYKKEFYSNLKINNILILKTFLFKYNKKLR